MPDGTGMRCWLRTSEQVKKDTQSNEYHLTIGIIKRIEGNYRIV